MITRHSSGTLIVAFVPPCPEVPHDNFVAITGDLHSFGAGYLRPDFDNPPQQPVGVSLLGGSVTSSNFVEQISFGVGGRLVPPETELTWAPRGGNPHLKYFNSAAHGYVIMEADHAGIRRTMKAVRTIRATEADLLTLRVFGVPAGQVRLTTLDTGTAEFAKRGALINMAGAAFMGIGHS